MASMILIPLMDSFVVLDTFSLKPIVRGCKTQQSALTISVNDLDKYNERSAVHAFDCRYSCTEAG
jgi:hypothetical protein